MIYSLRGKIIKKEKDFLVIDVNGVGYKVFVSKETQERISGETTLFCYTHITSQDVRLYGFKEEDNLSFFEALLKLSGVGPKSALHLASIAPMEELKKAIEQGDEYVIKKIMKLGKKKGERIIFELSQKKQVMINEDESVKALKNLGFENKDIERVLNNLDSNLSKEEKLKQALKMLGEQ